MNINLDLVLRSLFWPIFLIKEDATILLFRFSTGYKRISRHLAMVTVDFGMILCGIAVGIMTPYPTLASLLRPVYPWMVYLIWASTALLYAKQSDMDVYYPRIAMHAALALTIGWLMVYVFRVGMIPI